MRFSNQTEKTKLLLDANPKKITFNYGQALVLKYIAKEITVLDFIALKIELKNQMKIVTKIKSRVLLPLRILRT